MAFNQQFEMLTTLSPNEKDRVIDDRLQTRRQRHTILEQIKMVQEEIRKTRKSIQEQAKENAGVFRHLHE